VLRVLRQPVHLREHDHLEVVAVAVGHAASGRRQGDLYAIDSHLFVYFIYNY
jgi:hypothetical protein